MAGIEPAFKASYHGSSPVGVAKEDKVRTIGKGCQWLESLLLRQLTLNQRVYEHQIVVLRVVFPEQEPNLHR